MQLKRNDFINFLRGIEEKWRKYWDRNRVYYAEPKPGKEKFFITIPYPYVSAPLHVGHGRTYTIGDIIARYKRMRGYNVFFPMAFHITGTPIEAVSWRIMHKDPDTLKLYRWYISFYVENPKKIEKILKTFSDPWSIVNFFSKHCIKDFKSIGLSIDWRHRFTTGDPEYNTFVTWQFRKLYEKGFIKKGKYPLLFCTSHKNAVGEDDILGGDEVKAQVIEFNLIKFKLLDEDIYLVAATLRPETLFGVTNVWVNPEADYVLVKVDGEKWIISEKAAFKLSYQDRKIEIVEKFKGEKLIGRKVYSPLDNRELLVLPAPFVDPNNASGIVYSVPAHAPYDWAALVDLKRNPEEAEKYGISASEIEAIQPISIIEIAGYSEYPAKDACEKHEVESQTDYEKLDRATEEIYKAEFYNGILKDNCGEFAGYRISDVKDKVIEEFRSRGFLDVMYEVTALKKPVICRCGGEVIAAILPDQWFIDYSNERWKQLARECLANMAIIPEFHRRLFEYTIEWLRERPCARKRGIGTKLPFDPEWIIESLSDSTIYMAFYTVIHQIKRHRIKADQLTESFWDYVLLGKGDREKVSKETGIPPKTLDKLRLHFEYWYPVDLRHTAPPHITNHLTFFIFHHAAIFDEDKWPRAISINAIVSGREGRKMSKSYGNIIPLADVSRKYSTDLYRLYISSDADIKTEMDWREARVAATAKNLQRFWETAIKIIELPNGKGRLNRIIDKWLTSKLNTKIKNATEHIENFEIRSAIFKTLNESLEEIEKYFSYIEATRSSPNARLLKRYIETVTRMLAPVIPHVCEELWHRMGHKRTIVKAKWPSPDENRINVELEKAFDQVENLISDVDEIIKVTGKKFKKLYVYVAAEWKYKLLNAISRIYEEEGSLNPRILMPRLMKDEQFRRYGKQVSKIISEICKRGELWKYCGRDLEYKILKMLRSYIAKRLQLEKVYVVYEEKAIYDPKGKAAQSMPGRAALYLE